MDLKDHKLWPSKVLKHYKHLHTIKMSVKNCDLSTITLKHSKFTEFIVLLPQVMLDFPQLALVKELSMWPHLANGINNNIK